MKEDLISKRDYWIKKFSGELPRVNFEYDYKNIGIDKNIMENLCFNIPYESFKKLNQLSGGSDYTLHIILTTAVFVLLNKYTGSEDIIIGTPIYKENIDELITHVVPIRNSVCSSNTFKELLLNTRNSIIEANENSGYSLNTLLYQLNIPVYENEFNLVDVMVILENLQNINHIEDVKTNFKFLFNKQEKSIKLTIKFNKSLYSKNTVNRVGVNYIELLNNMLFDVNKSVAESSMLNEKERNHIIYDFNNKKMEFPNEEMIYDVVEKYASKYPEKVAIICENNSISYGDLNKKVNRLANYLHKCIKIESEDRIGIIMERSIDVIVAILGIWKAGGAYVPIDPEIPVERIKKIANNAKISMVITQERFLTSIKKIENECEYLKSCLCIDYYNNENEIELPSDKGVKNYNLKDLDQYYESFVYNYRKGKPSDIAYIIYTSGSTGEPKGAMVEHIGMMNHLYAKINDLNMDENCVVAQNASYCFDISVWQMFVALVAGGKTVIYPNKVVLRPEEFLGNLISSGVTILQVVPSYLSVILEVIQSNSYKFNKLKYLVITGETLKVPLVEKWFKIYPSIKIVNAYGPTEASDDITHYIMESTPNLERIPIGKPISNLNIYIVDCNMDLCPIGVKGEICVSGIGVGRGYFNDRVKTEKVFSQDKFKGDGRLYKTGDLGCWMEDGNIDFIGRKDYQVKIRGFRIELGEIESNILKHPNVKDVVVIDKEDSNGHKFLSAYVVPEGKLDISDLKEYIKQKLPEYMMPKYFIEIDILPLTSNGKVDRKSLPSCVDNDLLKPKYEAPRNELEEILINTLEDVLEIKGIGINDNFFEIGGDSITAMQVSSKLQKNKFILEIKNIFEKATVKELALVMKEIEDSIEQGDVSGQIGLTPIQKHFFEMRKEKQYSPYQIRMIFNKSKFEYEKVKQAFIKILEHHDTLRMRFNTVGKDIVQINRGINETLFDLSMLIVEENKNIDEYLQQELINIIRTMESTTDTLFKLALFNTKNGDYLAIIIDELIIDENSWNILLGDFYYIYNQMETNKEIILKEKTNSFKYFSDKLKSYFKSYNMKEESSYWQNVIEQGSKLDLSNYCNDSFVEDFEEVKLTLNTEQTRDLLSNVNWAYNTEVKDILLAALGLSVKKWAGIENIIVAMKDDGRKFVERYGACDRTVGCFTVQYPILLNMIKIEDISYIIKSIKDTLNNIPNNGIGYGLLRYLDEHEMNKESKLKMDPEIGFSYSCKLNNYNSQEELDLATKGMEIRELEKQNLSKNQCINIYADIINDKLTVFFEFDRIKYSNKSINDLSEIFRNNLIYIIEHCINRENSEQSPSDFSYDDLTIEDIEDLKDYIDNIKN